MAPNKKFALLKSMAKRKAELGGSAVGAQISGTPSIDVENIDMPIPLATVPSQGAVGPSIESREFQREKARSPAKAAAGPSIDVAHKRKRDLLDIPKESKKSKSSRSSRHRSNPVPVDPAFFAKNLEEYKVDPFGASANLFRHVNEVKNYEMAEFQRKTKDELVQVNAKLEHTANLLRNQGELLKEAQSDLVSMTTLKDEYKTKAENAETKIQELEAKVNDLETLKRDLEDQVDRLGDKVKRLEDDLEKANTEEREALDSSAEARIAQLQKELEESEQNRVTAAKLALEMAEEGFKNALEQLKLVYPDFQYDGNLIRADCEVEEGKIVYEDPQTEEKIVIYPEE